MSLTDDKREDGCGGRFHDEVLVAQLLDDELAVAVADGGAPRRGRRGGRLRARGVIHLEQKLSLVKQDTGKARQNSFHFSRKHVLSFSGGSVDFTQRK